MKGNIESPVCPLLPATHRIKATSQTAVPYVHIPGFDTELYDPSIYIITREQTALS
jgi:hypothetical protein